MIAALVRALEQLPKTDPHYKEYVTDYTNMCKALLPLQREDGFWNVSLKDPGHFGGKELTGTSLFTYGFAWGIRKGFLDKKIFLTSTIKAWNALAKDCVHPDGMLGYLKGTGKEPKEAQETIKSNNKKIKEKRNRCQLLTIEAPISRIAEQKIRKQMASQAS